MRKRNVLTQGYLADIDFEDLKNDTLYEYLLVREVTSQPTVIKFENNASKGSGFALCCTWKDW